MTCLPTLIGLLLATSSPRVNGRRRHHEPSEFLPTFLSRPEYLENSTGKVPDVSTQKKLSLTILVDNWSAFALVPTDNDVEADIKLSPARSLADQQRSVAAVLTSSSSTLEGLIGWTLVGAEDGLEADRLTIAWKMDTVTSFALALGDEVPALGDIWKAKTNDYVSASTKKMNERLLVADGSFTVAAEVSSSSSLKHYVLKVTIIPPNVDIWGWLKYYKKDMEAAQRKRSQSEALPKITKSPSTNDDDSPSLRDQKELLSEGPGLMDLHDQGFANLKEALASKAKGYSVAVGILVENWTRFRLGQPILGISSGEQIFEGARGIAPGAIEAAAAVGNARILSGTAGTIAWAIGKKGLTLSAMWSVPYNMQFYSSWMAVGIDAQPLTYKEMFSGAIDSTRFTRLKSGRDFEFSDGDSLVVMAYMDGSSSVRPVLRLALMPLDDDDLATNIRESLKMPIIRSDEVLEGSRPQVGLVQDASSSAARRYCPCAGSTSPFGRSLKFALVAALTIFRCQNLVQP